MSKRVSRQQQSNYDTGYKNGNQYNFQNSQKNSRKGQSQQYKCGDKSCCKIYHSYTAFYNHCKKSHEGEFPEGSLCNNKIYEGPSKNRGRPRIKKNQTKNQCEIQLMKRQNELIEFLGTLSSRKNQELITYVENPLERLQSSIFVVKTWLQSDFNEMETLNYLKELENFNNFVAANDLPQFYDPIETELYTNKLDSYNFASVYKFMTDPQKRLKYDIKDSQRHLLYKIFVIWVTRILSEKLLAEVVFFILQLVVFDADDIVEKQLLETKSDKLKKLIDLYFACFITEQTEKNN